MTEGKQTYCSVLVTGATLVYQVNERGNWTEPCYVNVAWQDDNTPVLRFSPFAMFGQTGEIEPIPERHLLATYLADDGVEKNYTQFINAYHEELKARVTQ